MLATEDAKTLKKVEVFLTYHNLYFVTNKIISASGQDFVYPDMIYVFKRGNLQLIHYNHSAKKKYNLYQFFVHVAYFNY